MKLHHINIKAPRDLLGQEKRFFCEVLGLREGSRPNFSSKGYWLYAEETAIVHLSESDKHFKAEKQGFIDHVAFQSTGLKKLVRVLEQKKITYSSVYLPDINMTQIFFRTPTCTRIEVNFENETI